MSDPESSSLAEVPHKPISTDELIALWDRFRSGGPAICPREGGAVAVAVDATAHAYRMICVRCGAASAWFESLHSGVRERTGTSSMPAGRPGLSDE
jgi:hypothetical protein